MPIGHSSGGRASQAAAMRAAMSLGTIPVDGFSFGSVRVPEPSDVPPIILVELAQDVGPFTGENLDWWARLAIRVVFMDNIATDGNSVGAFIAVPTTTDYVVVANFSKDASYSKDDRTHAIWDAGSGMWLLVAGTGGGTSLIAFQLLEKFQQDGSARATKLVWSETAGAYSAFATGGEIRVIDPLSIFRSIADVNFSGYAQSKTMAPDNGKDWPTTVYEVIQMSCVVSALSF